ncbi:MAG: DUF805 domain-containing protein, partial [Pseudomonadota bacterium]
VLQFVLGMLLTIPMIIGVFSETLSAVQSDASPEDMTAMVMHGMIGHLELQMWGSMLLGLITTAMVVASFVRRLHDAGFSGWIAVIPMAMQVSSLGYSVYVFDLVVEKLPELMEQAAAANERVNAMTLQAEVAPLSIIGWIGYIVVIGFGILKSQDGPNAYGDKPAAIG